MECYKSSSKNLRSRAEQPFHLYEVFLSYIIQYVLLFLTTADNMTTKRIGDENSTRAVTIVLSYRSNLCKWHYCAPSCVDIHRGWPVHFEETREMQNQNQELCTYCTVVYQACCSSVQTRYSTHEHPPIMRGAESSSLVQKIHQSPNQLCTVNRSS